jgi:hypothetical protein
MIKKIISGGHPGVEKAALDAALKLDIPYSGWAYKGRKTEEGLLPEKYKVKETIDRSFENRIEKNILEAAGTVIFSHGKLTIGLELAKELATKHKRLCLHIDLNESPLNIAAATIRAWMIRNEMEIVYFTGQKPLKDSDIYSEVIRVIESVQRIDTEDSETQNQ